MCEGKSEQHGIQVFGDCQYGRELSPNCARPCCGRMEKRLPWQGGRCLPALAPAGKKTQSDGKIDMISIAAILAGVVISCREERPSPFIVVRARARITSFESTRQSRNSMGKGIERGRLAMLRLARSVTENTLM